MTRVFRVAAAVAATVLLATESACGAILGQHPSTAGLAVRWTAGDPGDTTTVTWVANGLVVSTLPHGNGLIARNVSTGHTEWSWTEPAPPAGYEKGTILLTAAPSGGAGVVTYGYVRKGSNSTSQLGHEAGIDLASGRTIWSHDAQTVLGEGDAALGDGIYATVAGNPDAAYVAADIAATGKPAWSTASDPALRKCAFQALAFSGSVVYAAALCPGGKALYGLSARTGDVESKVTLDDPGSCDIGLVVWTVPGFVLVDCHSDRPSTDRLLELRPGSDRQLVLYSSEDGSIRYQRGPGRSPDLFLSGSTLYLPVQSDPDDSIDAVDLTSGKRLWRQATSGTLIGANASGALAVIGGDGTSPSLSTATLAAGSGAISYGPGATLDDYVQEDQPPALVGHTLIIAGDSFSGIPAIAYDTGSWPG